jgi:acetoin utilization deacetylase AcuC-like enzyme
MLKIAWNQQYAHSLPAGHRFPMEKYELLPQQLNHEGTTSWENYFNPKQVEVPTILKVHDTDYWERLNGLQLTRKEERRTGFPLSRALVERELTITGGTIQCAHFALQYGVSLNVAGGTHHAFTNKGEGFCLLNDQAITARYLLDKGLARKILIIDLDVHQGNGTAEIFEQESRVFTFSMHGAKNYPMEKMKSDLDVGLPDGTDDSTYHQILDQHLDSLIKSVQPDFLFFQSGVDILATDKLGKLGLSLEGCKERDRKVLSLAKKYQIPIVVCMGGGYSERIADIIEAHANTYRLAHELFF